MEEKGIFHNFRWEFDFVQILDRNVVNLAEIEKNVKFELASFLFSEF